MLSGAYEKKEQTRFYDVDPIENGTNFRLSCNLHVPRNEEGDVVSSYHNFREGSLKWVKTEADMSKTYAVIRKRGVHKKTREKYDVQFVRYIIYIMPLDEYNRVHRFLKTMKTYNLSDSYIIVSYQLDSDEEISIEPTKRENAKKLDTEDFRPTMHSVKQTLKEAVQNDPPPPPPIVLQDS